MASIGSTAAAEVNLGPLLVTNPTIARPTTNIAPNTEDPHPLPSNTKRFKITNRGSKLIKLAYALGDSSTLYVELYPHAPHEVSNIAAANIVLYWQSPGVSQQLEIESWT